MKRVGADRAVERQRFLELDLSLGSQAGCEELLRRAQPRLGLEEQDARFGVQLACLLELAVEHGEHRRVAWARRQFGQDLTDGRGLAELERDFGQRPRPRVRVLLEKWQRLRERRPCFCDATDLQTCPRESDQRRNQRLRIVRVLPRTLEARAEVREGFIPMPARKPDVATELAARPFENVRRLLALGDEVVRNSKRIVPITEYPGRRDDVRAEEAEQSQVAEALGLADALVVQASARAERHTCR